jgi:glycosyltransferase involved in cell wall biosynthesis
MAAQQDLTLALYSPASRGGAGWFVSALAQAIADAGAKVLFISPEAEPVEREPTSPLIDRRLLIRGTGGRGWVVTRALRSFAKIMSIFPALFRARLSTSIFIVTLYDWIPVLVLQQLWIRLLGGHLVFVVHDATPHAWAFPARFRSVEKWLFRLSYRLPQQIVCLTAALKSELASEWGRAANVDVIPHGAFTDGEPTALIGNHIVLVFGMLRRNKHILESIQAMGHVSQALPQLRMVIAGAPHAEDPDYWQECERALVGLESVISTEIGFVEEARLRELVAQCDAMLLPYEDFNSASGVAILACFAERLVVTTNVGGMGELASHGMEAVLIDRPANAISIARALQEFMQLPVEERRTRAHRTRTKLTEYLSWSRIGEAYVETLKNHPRRQ